MSPNRFVLSVFDKLARDADPSKCRPLAEAVTRHLQAIRRAHDSNPLVALGLAEQIANRLTLLLDELERLSPEHQRLALAAARYFVSSNDVNPDTETVLGLDDDASVMNHVAELLGRPELTIDF